MTILVIDGQGGRMGAALVEGIRTRLPGARVLAVGSNTAATAAMLKAGAQAGATGENPVLVNAPRADAIAGPMGIVLADALMGEITAPMAAAVARSPGHKVLLPVERCGVAVAGVAPASLSDYVAAAVDLLAGLAGEEGRG